MGHNLTIILVGARGDANIGAVARAMKNFGIFDLRLVACVDHLTKDSFMWAVDAKDVLENAKKFKNLSDALADTSNSAAFTRRLGKLRKKHMNVHELGKWISDKSGSEPAALVFGCEDKGLSNGDIKECDVTVHIPTCGCLPSINLAQSVMIACYELFGRSQSPNGSLTQEFVNRSEIEKIMITLKRALEALGYEDKPSNRLQAKILFQIEKLFGRGGLTKQDIGMFKGLCARIAEKAAKKAPGRP